MCYNLLHFSGYIDLQPDPVLRANQSLLAGMGKLHVLVELRLQGFLKFFTVRPMSGSLGLERHIWAERAVGFNRDVA
jgi:hypothetical protein